MNSRSSCPGRVARTARFALTALLGVLLLARAGSARGTDPDGFAKHALSRARADYRAGDYNRGADLLEEAANACGTDGCPPMLKAAVLRELGAMEFKRGNASLVPSLFAQARALSIELPFTHFDEPEMHELWEKANGAKGEEAPAPEPPASKDEVVAPSPERQAAHAWQERPRRTAHLWVGVTAGLEFALLPSADKLCKVTPSFKPANSQHAYCTDPSGASFPSRKAPEQNDALIPQSSGFLNGGFGVPDVRVLLAADYAIGSSLLVGARLGYVFGTYTGREAPSSAPAFRRNFHAELRGTYLFGSEPLAHTGFSPMAFVAAGTSDFDGNRRSSVSLSGVAGRMPVDIWVVGGPWFVGIGGGARYQFSPRVAFTAAARINAAFGVVGSLLTVGPELGVAYGF